MGWGEFVLFFLLFFGAIYGYGVLQKNLKKKDLEDRRPVMETVKKIREQLMNKWNKYFYGYDGDGKYVKADQDMLEAALGFIQDYREYKGVLSDDLHKEILPEASFEDQYNYKIPYFPNDFAYECIFFINWRTEMHKIHLHDIEGIEFCPHNNLRILSKGMKYPMMFVGCSCKDPKVVFKITGKFLNKYA